MHVEVKEHARKDPPIGGFLMFTHITSSGHTSSSGNTAQLV